MEPGWKRGQTMSSPMFRATMNPPARNDVISQIRNATGRIVALTKAEIDAARRGNLQTIKSAERQLARERESRAGLLRLLQRLGTRE